MKHVIDIILCLLAYGVLWWALMFTVSMEFGDAAILALAILLAVRISLPLMRV